jgi:hypothetical protein
MDRSVPLVLAGGTPAVHKGAMRTLLFLAALVLAPAAHAETLQDLHWLKGCWRTADPGPVITEVWSAPPMPAMIGYSYTTHDGETQGWEAMRIEMIDGAPTFIGMPGGNAAVRFSLSETLIHVGARSGYVGATFENAAHDYPQRIVYQRDRNALTATISRIDGSDAITFAYRRVSCASELRP